MPMNLGHLDRRTVAAVQALAVLAIVAATSLLDAWWLTPPAALVTAVSIREVASPRIPDLLASSHPDPCISNEIRVVACISAVQRRVAFGAPWVALVMLGAVSSHHRGFFLSSDGAYLVLGATAWLAGGWLYLRRSAVSDASLVADDPDDTPEINRSHARRVLWLAQAKLIRVVTTVMLPPLTGFAFVPFIPLL